MRRNYYLWYQFFRYGIVCPSLSLFYSRIHVHGTDHISSKKPLLFVANHQNTFLDALHVACNTRHFVHFLTPFEAFSNPILDTFYRSLNMLPVYRVRDGFGTPRRNEAIFEECFCRLQNNDAVLVFAEVGHAQERRIRPLSKGFTRIAFGAEAKYNWNLGLQVVPVGISYGRHKKSRTPVRVEFGEPVPASDYQQLYLEDEREAALQLKNEIASRLKTLTMHVSDLKHYPFYHVLLDELEQNRDALLNPELVNRRIALIRQQLNAGQVEQALELLQQAEKYDIDIREVVNPPRFEAQDLLLSPFYLFLLINNVLPYQLMCWLVDCCLKNENFEGALKYLAGLMLPLYYLMIGGLMYAARLTLPFIASYFLISVATAPLFVRAKNLLKGNPLKRLKRSKPGIYHSLKGKIETFRSLRIKLVERGKDEWENSG